MKHKVIRLLSIVCALSILIVTIPVTAYARTVDATTDTDTTVSAVLPEEEEQVPVTILDEEVEMREQNVKYFRCDDGTILAAVYSDPVHYKNGERWENIDNSLTSTNAKNGITYYTNRANDLKVRIPENLNDTAPVEVENRGFTLQWVVADSQSERVQLPVIRPSSDVLSQASAGDITATDSEKAVEITTDDDNQGLQRFANEEKTYIEKQNTDVTYANVYDKTDIRYTIVSNKLKESIIFETLPTKTSFAFFMQGAGLTAVLQQDNSVHFYAKETQEEIFVIAAPYMFDDNGEHSDNITVALIQQRDGWLYTLTPSREWLADTNRAYPVTLDPTVETAANQSNMMATEIYSGNANKNYGSSDKMYVGGYVSGSQLYECRALVKFDLPAVSSEYGNMQIVNAQLKLTNSSTGTPNDISAINMYQVTESWSENTVTWNTRPQTSSIVKEVRPGQSGAGESKFDLTALAIAWAKDSTTNHGVAFAAIGGDTYANAVQWYTEDAATTANRPAVTISYRECVGLEDYWTYTSMSVGRGASASVNNATGALTVVIPDCGIDGNRMPVSISHVHNSSYSKVATYGGKFRLNYQMSVTATDIADYPYYFTDGDGTKHYFKENEEELKDEDGLGLTLTETDDNTDEKFVITAKDKSKMVFNADGNLRFIRDTNNNEIEIVYNNGVIHQIIDGADRIYQFAYDANGRLASITDPAGRQTTYAYNSWDELNTICYPDGNVVNVFYNNAKVQRLRGNGQTVIFEYDTSAPIRVVGMSYYETTETTYIERYTFDYKVNATNITDIAGNTFTYQYNTFLQTICVINQTENSAQSYTMGKPGGFNGTENKLTSVSDTQKSVANYIVNGSLNRNFINDNSFQRVGSTIVYDAEKGHFGPGSIHISQAKTYSQQEEPTTYAKQLYTIPKEGYYMLSAYVSVNGVSTACDATLSVVSIDENGLERKVWLVPQAETKANEWARMYGYIQCYAGERIEIRLGVRGNCQAWFDDIQLEPMTAVANTYNLLEDADFMGDEDFTHDWKKWDAQGDWEFVTDTTSPSVMNTAVQIQSNLGALYFYQYVWINDGKAGDTFSLGGWAKANAIYADPNEYTLDKPAFSVSLEFFSNGSMDSRRTRISFNPYYDDWQFVAGQAIAPIDYDMVCFVIEYIGIPNSAKFALPFLYKDNYGQSYTYDKNGNVVSSADSTKAQSAYAYNDNQLSKLANPTGSVQLMTYDETTQNLEYVQTSDGQQYAYTYDEYGNATGANVYASPYATDLVVGTPYYIRNAYSGNAFTAATVAHDSVINNQRWSPADDKQLYCLVATDETDVYAIRPYGSSASGLRVDIEGGTTASTGQRFQLYNNNNWTNQRFKFEQNDNGTFTILTKLSDYTMCIDGQPGDLTDTEDDTPITHQTAVEGDAGQQWYLIPYTADDAQTPHYTSSATYTEDGNYLVTSTDSLGYTTSYETDTRGNTMSVTDANGVTTTYGYDTHGMHNTSVSVSKDNTNAGTVNYTYAQDRLTSISTANGTLYNMTYDAHGRADGVYIGNSTNGRMLSERTYNAVGLLERLEYGNGIFANYEYDTLGRQTKMWYSDSVNGGIDSFYNAQGLLGMILDRSSFTRTRYDYDIAGRVERVYKTPSAFLDGNLPIADFRYTYENGTNRLTNASVVTQWHGVLQNFSYGYADFGEMPDTVYGVYRGMLRDLAYEYDNLGRMTERSLYYADRDTTYTYVDADDGSNATSTQVASVTTPDGTTSYTYDAAGNIATETFGNKTVRYTYDILNQLTGVTGGDKTYAYTYDANGNILTAQKGTTTNTYTYGDSTWKDLLTAYNGQTITYDEIGNPLTYRDGISFTWKSGRQLTKYTKGNSTVEFFYYSDGGREEKKVGNSITYYIYVDGVLYAQKTGNDVLAFVYDEKGKPYMVIRLDFVADNNKSTADLLLNTALAEEYYYEYNLQGDVVGLIDINGNRVAAYTYDPWGKLLTVTDGNGNAVSGTHIAHVNPLRYRGYYYDVETGLYYLQSRYYDPEIGRWLNSDSITDGGAGFLGYNLFAYVANNPINNHDANGQWIIKNAIKWVSEKVVKPAVDYIKKTTSKVNRTRTRGVCANANWGPGVNVSIGVTTDTKGNIGFIVSTNASGGTPSAGVNCFETTTTAPTIYKQQGASYESGGSADVLGVSLGAEYVLFTDFETNDIYHGGTVLAGIGAPVPLEFHTGASYSWVYGINVYDEIDKLYIKIMEW